MSAQRLFPDKAGESVRHNALIETPKAYVSGICILLNDSMEVKGSIFNEFGVSAMDFSYLPSKDKVRLHHVIGFMDKRFIRRRLKKDLRELMHSLQEGKGRYKNEKYKTTYSLMPLAEEKQSEDDEVTE